MAPKNASKCVVRGCKSKGMYLVIFICVIIQVYLLYIKIVHRLLNINTTFHGSSGKGGYICL